MSKRILAHFKTVDPVLYKAALKLKGNGVFRLEKSNDLFLSLCREIIGQQFSGKVAEVIYGRFLKLFPKGKPTPERVLKIDGEKLRACGMAWAKVNSLKDLAGKVVGGELRLERIGELEEADVREQLLKVRGVGPWTAEMFLMFALGREDIFSHGDLGLRNAIKKLYKVNGELTVEYAEKLSLHWSPYRTYACRILWRSIDSK